MGSKTSLSYKTPVFTSCTSHVDALRALGVKRFLGTTYFRGDINKIYAQYFVDAGFDCLAMAGMDVDFDKVQDLPSAKVYDFIGASLRAAHPSPRKRSTCSGRHGARSISSSGSNANSAYR